MRRSLLQSLLHASVPQQLPLLSLIQRSRRHSLPVSDGTFLLPSLGTYFFSWPLSQRCITRCLLLVCTASASSLTSGFVGQLQSHCLSHFLFIRLHVLRVNVVSSKVAIKRSGDIRVDTRQCVHRHKASFSRAEAIIN